MSVIKRFGVLSVAKVCAAISLVIGLIAGILLILFGGLITLFMGPYAPEAAMGVGLGIVAIIILAIGGAIGGFIYGAVAAFIYNLAAGWFGGVEMDLE